MKKLLLIPLLFLTANLFSQTNLLTNPDFESSTAGATSFVTTSGGDIVGLPNQWQLTFVTGSCAGGCATGNSSIVTNTKFAGLNSLYLNITKQTNRNDIKLFQTFDATSAENYVLTFYAKSDVAGYPMSVDVLKSSQSYTTNGVAPTSIQFSTATGWTKYTFYVDLTAWTAAERTGMRVSVRPNTVTSTAIPAGPYPKQFWFDNFAFNTSKKGDIFELKYASIDVTKERQALSLAAGFTAEANALTTDIATQTASTPTTPVVISNALGFNPAPIATTAATNPFILAMHNWAALYLSQPAATYAKAVAGTNLLTIEVQQLGKELERLHWLLVSPLSDYQYNPQLFKRFLTTIYATTDDYVQNGDEPTGPTTTHPLNNWLHAGAISYGWRMADASFGSYLPATLKQQNINAATAMGTNFYTWGPPLIADEVYVNRDVSYAEILTHTGMLTNNVTWQNFAKTNVDAVTNTTNLRPDGGFCYLGNQNEVQNYHGANNDALAKIWSVTNYQPAWDALARGANYELLCIEGLNVPEFYTAPAWKTQWNALPGHSTEPLLYVTKNQHLKTKFDQLKLAYGYDAIKTNQTNPLNIGFYDPAIGTKPLKDNYVVYDRNIQGPRSRYGRFSHGITARNTSPGSTNVGLQTMVGAMTTKVGGNANQDEIDAALMAVHSKVHVKNSSTIAEWTDWGYMSADIVPKVCVSKTAATVSSPAVLQYQNGGPIGTNTAWSSFQQWITLPDRIIGVVETYPTTNVATNAFEIDGRVRFTYGRNGLKTPKNLVVDIAGQQYTYGNLRTIIHAHDFTSVSTGTAGTLRDDQSTGPASEIIFRYNLSSGTTLYPYPGTTKKYFIVEIRNLAATGNATVSLKNVGNVKGLIVKLNGKSFSSFRNNGTTPTTLALTSSLITGNTNVGFLTRNDTDTKAIVNITGTSYLLAGSEQILVVSSNDVNDRTKGWGNYTDLLASTSARIGASEGLGLENIFNQEPVTTAIAFPNPTNNQAVTVKTYLDEASEVNISFVDILGKSIISESLGMKPEGILNEELNISKLKAGMYFIKINHNDKTETVKFMKVE